MINTMKIDVHTAVVTYDPELNQLRGEFAELDGAADFFSDTVKGLQREGTKSLAAYLEMCRVKGLEPKRPFSGRFMLRLDPELHSQASTAAYAQGVSLNTLIERAVELRVASLGRYTKRK